MICPRCGGQLYHDGFDLACWCCGYRDNFYGLQDGALLNAYVYQKSLEFMMRRCPRAGDFLLI